MSFLGYALALLIGLSLGLLGGGGSILTIPVLHYVMGYGMKVAVPMSLVVVGLTSAVGSVAHWRRGTLQLRTALAFAPASVLGALLGAELGLRTSAALQLTVFAVVMLGAAVSMFFGQTALEHAHTHPQHPLPFILLVGGLVGLLTGFVGVGGGFLYVPALVLLGRLPMKQAVGTSLVLIMVGCIAGAVRYQGSLELDWSAIALFTAVALVGVGLGSKLVGHIPQTTLRHGFSIFLLLMGGLVLLLGR